jgi:hypothetical protein
VKILPVPGEISNAPFKRLRQRDIAIVGLSRIPHGG